MFFKWTSFVLAACLVGKANAVILRSGPKDLSVGLNDFVGCNDHNHGRRLAFRGHAERELGDFDWDIDPEPGYPTILFEGAGDRSEVRFLYNYTGTTFPGTKYIYAELFRGDCITPASPLAIAIDSFEDNTEENEHQVDVDILQDTVAGTPEYTDKDATSAVINFCVRVNYVYKNGDKPEEIINFHETNVTINIDLTANFTLTGISTDRIDADKVD